MSNPRSAQSIFALSPAIVLVCAASAFRGYFQGRANMKPTTISQVLEVFVKVVAGITLAWLLTRSGESLQLRSAGAIFGVTAGAMFALAYLFVYKKRKYRADLSENLTDLPAGRGSILMTLLKIGIPITVGSSVLSVITLIDTKLVLYQLQNAAGFAPDAADALYGVYSKAMTLYNLPAAFVTPLAVSVVPAIAAGSAGRRQKEAGEIAESSLRISAVIAMPMGVGLSVLAFPIMNVLYPGSNEKGPALLAVMGLASFFVCIALITNAVLQAGGNEKYPVLSMTAGGAVKIAVNWFLVSVPGINIIGAPIGTLCCYVVMCVLNFIFIFRKSVKKPSLSKIFVRPFLGSALTGVCAYAVYRVSYGLTGDLFSAGVRRFSGEWLGYASAMTLAIVAAVIVYLVMTVKTKSITLEDMKLIPKGEKLAGMLKIR